MKMPHYCKLQWRINTERAADIITMLITVYNEVSLEDKNKIAVNTASFIKERD